MYTVTQYEDETRAPGPAFALTHDVDGLIARGGFHEAWPTLAMTWFEPVGDIRKHRRAVLNVIRHLVACAIRGGQYKRIEAHVVVGDRVAVKFALRFGFALEHRLRRWGPNGEDYWLFSILPPEVK